MTAWLLDPGLYLLGVAVVPGVGLLLVCWGLWGDRSKGRPRCPHCGYDMRRAVPKLVCPACGQVAASERQPYGIWCRWRSTVPGCIVSDRRVGISPGVNGRIL